MKKKIILIATALIIIFLGIASYLYFNETAYLSKMKINNINGGKRYVSLVHKLFLKGKIKEEIIDSLGFKIKDDLIIIGKDSYQEETLTDVIKTSNLENYVKKHEELSNNLTKTIKDNLKFTIANAESYDDMIMLKIEYNSFNYANYINDLKALQYRILLK